MPTPGVRRGCGTRVQGGAYLEVPTGPHGKPIEYFLCDPPVVIDPAFYGLTAIGLTLFNAAGHSDEEPRRHVLDWVGSQHYPNVADFVEEARRLGVSRRIARTADFKGLGPWSRLFLVHSRAFIVNHRDYYERLERWDCPKTDDEHEPFELPEDGMRVLPEECCAGLWWHDVEGGGWTLGPPSISPNRYIRAIADITYPCCPRPEGVEPQHELAIFAIFPIVKVAVIKAADGSHELTEHAARMGRLPVSLEEE